MSKYPAISDNNFYTEIYDKFKQFKIKSKKKTFEEFCFPKKFELQIPQQFLSNFMNPETPYKGILIFHKIGAGKTCAAISIAETFKKEKNIIIVLPASLRDNFRGELRSLCAGTEYLTNIERNLLKQVSPESQEYKDIISISNKRINKYYNIYSYNKFIDLIKYSQINLNNTLLIIDEIQNMISESGSYYNHLYKAIKSNIQHFRLVLITATPIFDKPIEFALTMNLLLPDKQMPVGKQFIDTFVSIKNTKRGISYKMKNINLFKSYIKGYISYYNGAPDYVYPKSKISIVKCEMSSFQYKMYRETLLKYKDKYKDYLAIDIPNFFLIGSRLVSNFAFPNMKIGLAGFNSLKENDFDLDHIGKYSTKFLQLYEKIRKCKGTIFIYSNFKGVGGIRTLVRFLEHQKYLNYNYHGKGNKRFAVWSGDETLDYKEEIKTVFNNINNLTGKYIKIIIGSSAIKEGVSLLRVRQVHILEPYWNYSRLNQIMGRAIRFCSHKDVAESLRIVKVYIYLAVSSHIKISVDQRIINMAITKKIINSQFEKAIMEGAIDCLLFSNANDSKINCDK